MVILNIPQLLKGITAVDGLVQQCHAAINFLQRYSIEGEDFLNVGTSLYLPHKKSIDGVESRARTSAQKIPNSKLCRETHVDHLLGLSGSHSSGVPVEREELDREHGEVFRNPLQSQDFHQEQVSRLTEPRCCLFS